MEASGVSFSGAVLRTGALIHVGNVSQQFGLVVLGGEDPALGRAPLPALKGGDDPLGAALAEQCRGLIAGGVDAILIET